MLRSSTMLDSKARLQITKRSILHLFLKGVFIFGLILKSFHQFRPCLCRLFDMICGVRLSSDIYWKSLFSREMLDGVVDSILVDWNKTTQASGKVFNSPLVTLDGEYCRLLDWSRPKRPLIVNFGSLTCPVFMKNMEQYQNMVKDFQDVADFVIVYTEEAHPSDGWALENNFVVPSPKTQNERCAIARLLSTHNASHCPVLVDTMLNAANIAYGAFPIRLYVIKDDHVVYQGGAGPTGYKVEEVSDWLKKNTKS